VVGDLPADALQGGNAAVGADGAEGAHRPAGKALHGAEHVAVRLLLGRIHQAIRRSGAPTYTQMSATKTIIYHLFSLCCSHCCESGTGQNRNF
jgi:hypothetical protein